MHIDNGLVGESQILADPPMGRGARKQWHGCLRRLKASVPPIDLCGVRQDILVLGSVLFCGAPPLLFKELSSEVRAIRVVERRLDVELVESC